jgi:hypothetical protein
MQLIMIAMIVPIKDPMPQGADREAFMKLENDVEFLESLANQTKDWPNRRRGH